MLRRVALGVVVLAVLLGSALSVAAGWCQVYTDSDQLLWSNDNWVYTWEVNSTTTYRLTLSVPWSGDFDVKIYRDDNHNNTLDGWDPLILSATFGWVGVNEDVTFRLSPDTYFIKVYSYTGSGWYTLKVYRSCY